MLGQQQKDLCLRLFILHEKKKILGKRDSDWIKLALLQKPLLFLVCSPVFFFSFSRRANEENDREQKTETRIANTANNSCLMFKGSLRREPKKVRVKAGYCHLLHIRTQRKHSFLLLVSTFPCIASIKAKHMCTLDKSNWTKQHGKATKWKCTLGQQQHEYQSFLQKKTQSWVVKERETKKQLILKPPKLGPLFKRKFGRKVIPSKRILVAFPFFFRGRFIWIFFSKKNFNNHLLF